MAPVINTVRAVLHPYVSPNFSHVFFRLDES
jgi:hypothetical protein